MEKHQRLVKEIQKFFVYFIFFTLFFWTFTVYTRLLEGEYGISLLHFGYGAIEGLILAKIIMLGEMLHLGERFSGKPLIISTLWKTLAFCIFVMVFSVVEKFLTGWFKGESALKTYYELKETGQYVIFSKMLIMFFVFFLFFAFLEIDRVLGDNKLMKLFFQKRDE